jgi:hydroxymethylbilane synthase
VSRGFGPQLHFKGLVAMPDGSEMFQTERVGSLEDAVRMGREAGEELKARAGEEWFKKLYEVTPTPNAKASVSA